MIEGTRIVKLSPSTESVKVATFEEAFGEHSEWRGHGRARRQKRAKDRIAKRRERKQLRQQMRSEQQEARQQRKDTRHSRKKSREDADNVETPSDEQTPTGQETAGAPQPDQTGGNQGGAEGAPDSVLQQGGGDSGGSDLGNQAVSQGESLANEGGGTGNVDMGESETSNVQQSETENLDESSEGFNGGQSNPHATFDNIEFSNAEGEAKMKVHPHIQDVAHKIAWNSEMIKKLSNRNNKLQSEFKHAGDTQNRGALAGIKAKIDENKAKIETHKERIAELKSGLHKEHGKNHPHIPHALKNAHEKIQKHIESKKIEKESAKNKKHIATEVSHDLHPKFSHQKIVVPAVAKKVEKKGSFNAQDHYDTYSQRTVELGSSANGDTVVMMSATPQQKEAHLLRNVLVVGAIAGLAYLYIKNKK